MPYLIVFFLLVLPSLNLSVSAQAKTDTLLENLLLSDRDSLMQQILSQPQYRCQIIYTRIDRDRKNRPHFTNYYYHTDPELYFNPASTVKMPLAFLSLEKLHRMHLKGVNKFTSLMIDSSYPGQDAVTADTTAENGLPSIAQYIKKAFLVSDNDAYNRMYEFLGQGTVNRELHKKGYPDVRIIREFLPMTEDENRHTNAIRFISSDGRLIYRQPPAYNRDSFDFSHVVFLGKGHWNAHDSLVDGPMDFTRQNNISLEDLQQIEQSVLFPRSVPKSRRFDLDPGDYRFLYQYMSQYPSETNDPKYDSSLYDNSYVKFYFRGERIPSYIRVFNKVGWSYGFLTDISYVADFRHKVEYMLSCTLYVNSDGILNDNRYDYDSRGHPFLRRLGNLVYQYELSRPRAHRPDLGRFRITYEKRDPLDKRKPIREIAN